MSNLDMLNEVINFIDNKNLWLEFIEEFASKDNIAKWERVRETGEL